MQCYTVYLETALYVSGGTSTHHQERKQLYLQHLVFVIPLLLYAAIIVEELELSSNSSTIAAGTQTTVSTVSDVCHTVTATCRYRGRVGTQFQLFHDSCR